jgi:hypothetical protein
MKRRFTVACVLVVVCSWTVAEEKPEPPPAGPPGTALEVLQRHIERTPRPLESRNTGLGFGFSLGGAAATLGCVGLALIPTIEHWSPEDVDDSSVTASMLGGLFQGMYVNFMIGFGITELILPARDLRAEYGALLDLDEKDREQQAAQILQRLAEREKQRRVAAALLTVAATALPAGAYYLGTRIWGPNPNVEKIGQDYLVGIVLGSLVPALIAFTVEDKTERLYQQSGRRE